MPNERPKFPNYAVPGALLLRGIPNARWLTRRHPRTTFTRAEVAARASAGASVFIVDGDVIDFGGFAHPGGHAILRRHAGEDVSAVFRGTRAGEGRRYAHSDGARRMLRRLRVGTIETLESETRDEPPKPTEPKARRVRSVATSVQAVVRWRRSLSLSARHFGGVQDLHAQERMAKARHRDTK